MFLKMARAAIVVASLILVASRVLPPAFSQKARPLTMQAFVVSQLQVRRS